MNISRKIGLSISLMGLSGVLLTGCGSNKISGSKAHASTSNATAKVTKSTTTSKTSKSITIGYDGYFEDIDITELWKQLLEKHGWNVQTKELDNGPLFTSMYKGGPGSINVFMDVWMPHTSKVYMDKYGSHYEELGVWHKHTRVGLVVPKYVYDKGIHTIGDLESHAKMFNNQIVGITPGVGEMITTKKKVMPTYKLGNFKLVQGSATSMLTALEKAESAHKPIVVTLWSPHWIFAKYQLKYLQDPKNTYGTEGVEQIEANKTWAQKHPQIKTWMSKFSLNKNQLDSLGLMCKKDGKVNGVKAWMNKNQSLVNNWFKS